jgi:hypothetical protein
VEWDGGRESRSRAKGDRFHSWAATRIDGTVNIYTEGLDPVNHLKYYRNRTVSALFALDLCRIPRRLYHWYTSERHSVTRTGLYQDVEAADVVAEPRGELGDGCRVGDVEPPEHDGEPAVAERRGGGIPARAVPRGEHHGEAVLRESRGERVPDAPVRAGHHRHRLPRPPRAVKQTGRYSQAGMLHAVRDEERKRGGDGGYLLARAGDSCLELE